MSIFYLVRKFNAGWNSNYIEPSELIKLINEADSAVPRAGQSRYFDFRRIESEVMFRRDKAEIPNQLQTWYKVDYSLVTKYAEMGTPFPPLVIVDPGVLADGVHRLVAAHMLGHSHVDVFLPIDMLVDQIKF